MLEKVLVACDYRLGIPWSCEGEQVVVAAVAQDGLWIDRAREHHRDPLECACGLLRLALIEQRAEVGLLEVLAHLGHHHRARDHFEAMIVDRIEQRGGRCVRLADKR